MLIFATIFGVGFLLLIVNLIFGHDVDHPLDHDASSGIADGDLQGPSIFSVRMISLLILGFGALSFGVRATTKASMFVASMFGVLGAAIVGAAGYFIIRAFYASQASSIITDRDLIGSSAMLIDAVPENGLGQISCVLCGREITYMARSQDNKAISRGTSVRVVGKTGSTVIVEAVV